MEFALNLYLLKTHHPFLLCNFCLKWRCLSYACPTIVFWKHLSGFAYSQLERNEPQDEPTIQISLHDLEDIYLRLRTLSFRVDAGMS